MEAIVSYSKLSQNEKAYSLCISAEIEPKTFKEDEMSKEWTDAMNYEIHALEVNNTWFIVPFPSDKKALGYKCVFKIKRKYDGFIERYNASLMDKDFNQQEDIDFVDTFSPMSIKLLLALVAQQS